MVPLVIVQTLSNMSPFWAALLAWLVIGERMNSLEISALCISFVGVYLIANGKHHQEELVEEEGEEFEMYGLSGSTLQIVGCLVLLLHSFCAAIVTV